MRLLILHGEPAPFLLGPPRADSKPISSPAYALGAPLQLTSRRLVLHLPPPPAGAAAKATVEPPPPLLDVALPEGANRFIAIVEPMAGVAIPDSGVAPPSWSLLHLIAEDATTFPLGSLQVVNLLPVELAVLFDQSQRSIPSGSRELIRPTAANPGALTLKAAYRDGTGDYKLMRENVLWLPEGTRALGLALVTRRVDLVYQAPADPEAPDASPRVVGRTERPPAIEWLSLRLR